MNTLRNMDGSVLAVYLDIEDMPVCRACGCAPVEKWTGGSQSLRLQCPKCGIRTGGSTCEQAAYGVWADAMGDPGTADRLREEGKA